MNKATSIYLDLVRFLAATTVFLVHAQYDRFTTGIPLVHMLAGLGNDAVMVFFVLSGFVIAYVARAKEKTLKDYSLSRLARLYSVAAPALILTVVADYIGSRIDYGQYSGWGFQTDHPVWRLASNFFFINELWFHSVRPFSNAPYWSLGYEFWYYALFAAAYYLNKPLRYVALAAICLLVGPKILLLFPIWLLGVWAYSRITTKPVSEPVGWVLFLGSIAAYLIFLNSGSPQLLLDWTINQFGSNFVNGHLAWSKYFLDSYIVGPLVALNFVGVAAIAPRIGRFLESFEVPIRYMARYTFALYLFHFPLLQCLAVAGGSIANVPLRNAFVVFGTLLIIWAVGTLTEAWRPHLKVMLSSMCNGIQRRAFAGGKS